MEALTPYIGTIVTVVIAVVSVYAGFTARIAKLEALIGELEKKIDRHNQIVERTYKLEGDVDNLFHRYEEIRSDVKGMKIGGTD